MDTELVTRAAARIREIVVGTFSHDSTQVREWNFTPDRHDDQRVYPQCIISMGNAAVIANTFVDPAHEPWEAHHIATWDPLTACAVADLMEMLVEHHGPRIPGKTDMACDSAIEHLARLILGEPR